MTVVAVTDLPADGWDAAPLISARRARGQVSRRRDLRRLDPDFLTNQLDEAWPGYLATYYARNRSIGSVLFDREDVEAELRLLLVEAATRFDASRGSGSFVAWACSQQRAHLIDISRRRMGRSVSDAAIQASRGVDIPEQMKRDIAAFHSLARPVPIDVAFGPDSRPLTETLADLSKPSVEDIAMTIDQCSRCDAVDECVAGNVTSLEDVAGVIGCPPPSLHVHLVQHDRDDLLRRLTYNGEPILPSGRSTPTTETKGNWDDD